MPAKPLRAIIDHEASQVECLLGSIHRTAARLFAEGWAAGIAQAWIQAGAGVFAAVYQDDYVVCYGAFRQDPPSSQVMAQIDRLLTRVLANCEGRPVFYNVRGDNLALIQHLRSRGFKGDAYGYELVCHALPPGPVHLCGLEMRGYEFQYFDAYIHLLDQAFNPLVEQASGSRDYFWHEKEQVQAHLARLSEKGDFVSFWKGHNLVGLYYLKADLIDILAVHPDYQQRGYGGVILQHAAQRLLHQRHFPAAYLFVEAGNERAWNLYLRRGFEISGFYAENTFVGITC